MFITEPTVHTECLKTCVILRGVPSSLAAFKEVMRQLVSRPLRARVGEVDDAISSYVQVVQKLRLLAVDDKIGGEVLKVVA